MQPTMGQRLSWSWPASVIGDALRASLYDGEHDEGPEEELKIPRTGRARRVAWEPESASSVLLCTQPSCTLQGHVLHYLGKKEDLEPRVAVLKALRQMQLGPETQRRPSSRLESIPELDETPELELRPVSPASAPAEPEDVPAVASAPVPGPKLEPHEPSAVGPGTPVGMAPGLREPEACLDPTRPCAMSPWDIPGVVSCPELEPREPSAAGRIAPTGMAPSTAEPEAGPAPTSPCAASTPCAVREEPLTILQFPPRLVAEQLTLMCAELFTNVTRYECEAYIAYKPQMGRRYQPEKASIEHVAPTIHKVNKQFEATVRLVTTSCLGTPSMTAQDRARVVEFWIRVAKDCETFLNFACLHAILLALQCPPVGRLKRTWGHVSWKSSYMFKKLKKMDKKADRQWFHEEAKRLLMRWQWEQRTPDYQENQGMVPFLGYILDDVPMDPLPEHNDEVISILDEIAMQKRVARQYDLDPDERVQSFLQAVEPLDEQQSYNLSCELEPEGQRAGRKGLLQFFRRHKI